MLTRWQDWAIVVFGVAIGMVLGTVSVVLQYVHSE
jgi:hypothetical protein